MGEIVGYLMRVQKGISYESENRMIVRKQHLTILFVLILTLFFSCAKDQTAENDDGVVYVYQAPALVGDGWETASLQDVGLDPGPITSLMEELLNRNDHLYHGLLIVKDGKLILEEYFDGFDMDIFEGLNQVYKEFDRETLHFQASVTKSVTSILVGIAMDNGFLPGVDTSVLSLYPEYADLIDGQRDLMTIHHMLAMCSGLDWDESTYPHDDPLSHHYQMLSSDDPVRFVLSLPIIAEAGTSFHYNSGTTNVLGDLVRKTSGLILTEFAQQYLFGPLGIEEFEWFRCQTATDVTFASGGLYIRPRDMAKLGQLYLQDGLWNGQQLVSANWIQASTTESISLPSSMVEPYHSYGYGYQWWLERYNSGALDAYSGRGWGGQYIVVLPGVDLVVVFTAGAFDISAFSVPMIYYDIIQDYILPSLN